jgi:hypothetical protein
MTVWMCLFKNRGEIEACVIVIIGETNYKEKLYAVNWGALHYRLRSVSLYCQNYSKEGL